MDEFISLQLKNQLWALGMWRKIGTQSLPLGSSQSIRQVNICKACDKRHDGNKQKGLWEASGAQSAISRRKHHSCLTGTLQPK